MRTLLPWVFLVVLLPGCSGEQPVQPPSSDAFVVDGRVVRLLGVLEEADALACDVSLQEAGEPEVRRLRVGGPPDPQTQRGARFTLNGGDGMVELGVWWWANDPNHVEMQVNHGFGQLSIERWFAAGRLTEIYRVGTYVDTVTVLANFDLTDPLRPRWRAPDPEHRNGLFTRAFSDLAGELAAWKQTPDATLLGDLLWRTPLVEWVFIAVGTNLGSALDATPFTLEGPCPIFLCWATPGENPVCGMCDAWERVTAWSVLAEARSSYPLPRPSSMP